MKPNIQRHNPLHDRTGRLEKVSSFFLKKIHLHDRTGRLEIYPLFRHTATLLHDRTGRLENT